MKVKKFFRMMLCSLALLSFAACSDDGNGSSFIDDGKIGYMGDIVVFDAGSTFTDKNITIELTFNETSKTCDMLIKQVKFADKMPVRLDMSANGISYTESGSKITISGNNIVPQAMGGPFPMYTITNLSGQITESGFSFAMKCGEFPVSFEGKAVLTSAK